MVTIGKVLERLAEPIEPVVYSGVADLDNLTQGVRPGRVWVLTGAPRQGRTMLAAQFARRAAEGGRATTLLAGADDLTYVGALIAAAATRRSLFDALHNWRRFEAAREGAGHLDRIRELSIELTTRRHGTLDEALPRGRHDFVVIDDADLWGSCALAVVQRVCLWAGADRAAVVTVPRSLVGPEREDWQEWVRLATVVIQIELGTGDDLGAWHLDVMSNRRGPVGLLETGALCAQARSVDLA